MAGITYLSSFCIICFLFLHFISESTHRRLAKMAACSFE